MGFPVRPVALPYGTREGVARQASPTVARHPGRSQPGHVAEGYAREAGFDSGRWPLRLRTTANRKRVSGIDAARTPQSRRLHHCARRHYRRDRPANGHIRPTSRKRFPGTTAPATGRVCTAGFDSGRRAPPEGYAHPAPRQQSFRFRRRQSASSTPAPFVASTCLSRVPYFNESRSAP